MTTNQVPPEAKAILTAAKRVLEEYPSSGKTPGYLGGYDQECVNEAYGLLQEALEYLEREAAREKQGA